MVLDASVSLTEKMAEVNAVIAQVPVRKGLATLGGVQTKKVDPFVQALNDAKQNY